jgi:hypothetical protein
MGLTTALGAVYQAAARGELWAETLWVEVSHCLDQ